VIDKESIYGIGAGMTNVTTGIMFGEDFRLLELSKDDFGVNNNNNTISISTLPRICLSYVFYHKNNKTAQIRAAELRLIDQQLKVVNDVAACSAA